MAFLALKWESYCDLAFKISFMYLKETKTNNTVTCVNQSINQEVTLQGIYNLMFAQSYSRYIKVTPKSMCMCAVVLGYKNGVQLQMHD